MGDNSNKSLGESSDDSSYESDNTFEIGIEVQQVDRSQYHMTTVMAAFMVTNHVLKYVVKEKKTTSILSGQLWFIELITGNDNRFFEQLRMRKQVFQNLVSELTNNCGLTPAKHIGVEESVGIFLYMIGQPSSYRNAQERFQHYRSVHDAKILMDTLRKPNLRFPYPTEGKYYLVDSGYPSLKGFLALYKNARSSTLQ
ncbi:hypothetical protein KIW84_062349 [Lathyrus oleraceus]|uniref:DUF8040 domain-containing protein n=1 Tax=Pisum sativum TaxID=3888 RepID=A0A9D4W869_PEA|nr:hypothetical protein KIW84_062349 [Pisum sativum]